MKAALLDLLQEAKVAGCSATLSFSTVGGTLKVKFEIDLASTSSPPASSISTTTSHRGPAAVAHSHARAAAHQASLAMPTSSPPPPPRALISRLVKAVQRKSGSQSSFCQLDGEGGIEVDSEEDLRHPQHHLLVCPTATFRRTLRRMWNVL